MNLKAEREAIAEILSTAEIPAAAHVPARPVPPLALVGPGSPYLEGGDAFGSRALRHDVWLVLPAGSTNEAASDIADDYIGRAVEALEADDLLIESVAQPIEWTPAGGGTFLAVIIAIRSLIANT